MGTLPSVKTTQNSNQKANVLFMMGIVLVAFNLRPSITAVGPLINSIRLDTNITNTAAGLLTTIPLLAFAVFSIIAPKIGRAIGNETAVFIAMVILTIGILMRSMGYVSTLFLGTAILGLGITVGNVLLPGIVKQRYPHKIGLITAIYTTSMGTMAALASGVSVPLAAGFSLGWEKALAFWGILAGLAVLLWAPQLKYRNFAAKVPELKAGSKSILRSPLAWQVTLFMGFQSWIFYCMITWLPEILSSQGLDVPTAGWMVGLMQFAGLPATFLVPILAGRLPNQKPIVLGIGLVYLIAFTGLIAGGNMYMLILYIILMGLGQGAGISLALTLFGLRTKDSKEAANLSGMAQSFGYLLAAIGPVTIGLLFDLFNNWTFPLLVCLLITSALLIFGLGAARNKLIFD
ncbi:MAG: MFS transporter [Bacillus sp. (in: Bacteria)]|nr:MFS transporter [Bacillus sp. (in: firmicutes)]